MNLERALKIQQALAESFPSIDFRLRKSDSNEAVIVYIIKVSESFTAGFRVSFTEARIYVHWTGTSWQTSQTVGVFETVADCCKRLQDFHDDLRY